MYCPKFTDEKETKVLKDKLIALTTKQLDLLEEQIDKEIIKRETPDWDLSELSKKELRDLGTKVFLEAARKKGDF
jgi:hypothetical protein